jgi:hypothetical protein
MDLHDVEIATLIIVAALAALVRIVPLLFRALRVCIREYRAFCIWLRERSHSASRW